MSATPIEHVWIPVSHGTLEGLLKRPPGARGAAVLCHPHPQYGGSLHSKVIYRAAKALEAAGFGTLRFNFRGVGRSTGAYGGGQGEEEDVRAALAELRRLFPGLPVTLAGFSFGAAVGLRVGAADSGVARLIALGLPTRSWSFEFLEHCPTPKHVVQGSADEHGPIAEVRAVVARWAPPAALAVVEGADHFFTGRLDELAAAVAGAVAE